MDSLLATDRQRRGHVMAIPGLPGCVHVPAASPGRGSPHAPGGSRRRACRHCLGAPPHHRAPSSPTLGGSCLRSPSTRTQPLALRRHSASDATKTEARSAATPEPSNGTPHPDDTRPASAFQAIRVSSLGLDVLAGHQRQQSQSVSGLFRRHDPRATKSSPAQTSSFASSTSSSDTSHSISAGSSQSHRGRPGPSRLCPRTGTETNSGIAFRTRRT